MTQIRRTVRFSRVLQFSLPFSLRVLLVSPEKRSRPSPEFQIMWSPPDWPETRLLPAPPLMKGVPAASRLTVTVWLRLSRNTDTKSGAGERSAMIAMVVVLSKIRPQRRCASAGYRVDGVRWRGAESWAAARWAVELGRDGLGEREDRLVRATDALLVTEMH